MWVCVRRHVCSDETVIGEPVISEATFIGDQPQIKSSICFLQILT